MKHCHDVQVLKVLYNAYIRSHLDYCSPVWSPTSKCMIDKVERVQKRFVKFLCFQSGITYNSSDYVTICEHFKLATLYHRRKVTDVVLCHKILHCKVNCAYLVSLIHFNLPTKRTRHTRVLTTATKNRLVLRKNSFFPRSLAVISDMGSLDFFDIALSKCVISKALV